MDTIKVDSIIFEKKSREIYQSNKSLFLCTTSKESFDVYFSNLILICYNRINFMSNIYWTEDISKYSYHKIISRREVVKFFSTPDLAKNFIERFRLLT